MAIAATIGKVAILDFNACFPDSVVGFVPGRTIERDFLFSSLEAAQAALEHNSSKNTQSNLNIEQVGDVSIVVPPSDEQLEILDSIRADTDLTDRSISSSQRTIASLKERRSALISAAVTGQIPLADMTTDVTPVDAA